MNERIQALADEAEDYADSIVDAGGEFHPAYTRKFAELLIRECMELGDKALQDGKWPGDVLKEHFGVDK